jgi:hypothetical protein
LQSHTCLNVWIKKWERDLNKTQKQLDKKNWRKSFEITSLYCNWEIYLFILNIFSILSGLIFGEKVHLEIQYTGMNLYTS